MWVGIALFVVFIAVLVLGAYFGLREQRGLTESRGTRMQAMISQEAWEALDHEQQFALLAVVDYEDGRFDIGELRARLAARRLKTERGV